MSPAAAVRLGRESERLAQFVEKIGAHAKVLGDANQAGLQAYRVQGATQAPGDPQDVAISGRRAQPAVHDAARVHTAVVEIEIGPFEGEVAVLLRGGVVEDPLGQASNDCDAVMTCRQVVRLVRLLLPILEALAGLFQPIAEFKVHIPDEGA